MKRSFLSRVAADATWNGERERSDKEIRKGADLSVFTRNSPSTNETASECNAYIPCGERPHNQHLSRTSTAVPAAWAAQPKILRVDAVVVAPWVVRAVRNGLLLARAPQLVKPDLPRAGRRPGRAVALAPDLHARALRGEAKLLAGNNRRSLLNRVVADRAKLAVVEDVEATARAVAVRKHQAALHPPDNHAARGAAAARRRNLN